MKRFWILLIAILSLCASVLLPFLNASADSRIQTLSTQSSRLGAIHAIPSGVMNTQPSIPPLPGGIGGPTPDGGE